MKGNTDKLFLGHTLAEVDNGMPNSILTDCEAYGMVSGCDENCPVLIAGKCELQDTDNKDLYELAKEIYCYEKDYLISTYRLDDGGVWEKKK